MVIVFLAGLLVGFGLVKKPAVAPTTGNQSTEIKASLMFDYGKGKIQTYNEVEMQSGQTVFDLLKKVTTENQKEFSFKDYGGGLGAFVESINGVRNDAAKNLFWYYWVNNQFAEVGASSYQLVGGEVVEWKYTKSQYNQ